MKRSMQLFVKVVIVVMWMALTGCGSSGSESGTSITDDDTDNIEIPEGATVLSDESYDELLGEGLLIEISDDDQEVQALAFEAQYEEDMGVIDDFEDETGIDPRPGEPNEEEGSVEILPDENVRHTITLNDGSTRDVVTLGRKLSIKAIADGIRVYPTRDNQMDIYRKLYEATPSDLRMELELPDPEEVEINLSYTESGIQEMNVRITDFHEAIIGSIETLPVVVPDAYDCSTDIGSGEDSDRDGCSSAVEFQATGIFLNHDWNHKEHLTCVKDQGPNRGTCCAFAVVSAAEYWVSRRLDAVVNLSEQALYNMMKLNWVRDDLQDGYYISDALDYAIAEGYLLPFEYQWNYNPSLNRTDKQGGGFYHSCDNYSETCSNTTHQSEVVCNGSGNCSYYVPEKNPDFLGIRLKSGHVLWDHNDPDTSYVRIILSLAFGDPVLIQVPVLAQFDAASATGYVTYAAGDKDNPATQANESTNRGNHIMHAVSFIDNNKLSSILPDAPPGSGGGYVIVKNSWSNRWGDGGYVYLPYDFIKEYTQYASVLTAIMEE